MRMCLYACVHVCVCVTASQVNERGSIKHETSLFGSASATVATEHKQEVAVGWGEKGCDTARVSEQADARQQEKKRGGVREMEVILHHRLDSALLVVVNRKWGQQQEVE